MGRLVGSYVWPNALVVHDHRRPEGKLPLDIRNLELEGSLTEEVIFRDEARSSIRPVFLNGVPCMRTLAVSNFPTSS